MRTEKFAAEAHRQSALIASAEAHTDDLAFIEAITVDWDE
jgi:hypothetical protein